MTKTAVSEEYLNEELGIIADMSWEMLRVGDLRELEEDGESFFQRTFTQSKFAAIDKHFDPRAVGTLVISRRSKTDDVVLDGRHRKRACEKHGVEFVHCQVLSGLTRKEEAKLFILFNNRGSPKAIELFRANTIAGDEFIGKVIEACDIAGWKVRKGTGVPCCTQAAHALCQCYKYAPRASNKSAWLSMILSIIKDIWPEDGRNGEAIVIQGVDRFWKKLPMTPAGRTRLVAKLSQVTLDDIRRRASQLRSVYGKSGHEVFAIVMLEEYNKGLHQASKLYFPEGDNE